MLNVYRFCFVVLIALTVFVALRERSRVSEARREGYAAAVDSVRAVGERPCQVCARGWATRTLDSLGLPYRVIVYSASGESSLVVNNGRLVTR